MTFGCDVHIASRRVVASGTIIAENDKTISISKIATLGDFTININFNFHDDTSLNQTYIEPMKGKTHIVNIEISVPWSDEQNSTSNHGVAFAENDQDRFYFAHSFYTNGTREDYNVTLLFIVLAEPIK